MRRVIGIDTHRAFGEVIHDGGELGHLLPDLVGDGAPLGTCGFRHLLGEGGGDEGGDDTAAALAGVGENVAHEVDPEAVEEPIVGRAIRKPPTSPSQQSR